MGKNIPKVTIGRKPAPPETAVRALEKRQEARQASPAGELASSQAGELPARRSATKADPYVRKDGTATRGTTVYLPIDLADRLRRFAFGRDRKQSDVVAAALEQYLEGEV
jgi:predicted transcriptional regulator